MALTRRFDEAFFYAHLLDRPKPLLDIGVSRTLPASNARSFDAFRHEEVQLGIL